MGKFSYGVVSKLGFYTSYFWYKLILPFEVHSPRLTMWFYEWGYTLHKFRDYEYCKPWLNAQDVITTRFGTYRIRRGTADAANVSPAFERRDLNRLFSLVAELVQARKRVLFLDIGGDIGTYSIAVAKRFELLGVDTICFEPIPSSCELIIDNIKRNELGDKVELMEVALMEERQESLKICLNTLAPGSSSVKGEGEEVLVRADRLDSLLIDRMDDYQAVVLKIDVEGVEESVLRGASGLLEQGVETYLMVEDFIDQTIITYLEETGWSFEGKLTEYNSWWKKN
ncbi:FkbM family methyltransferase [Pontiellaceae bacterium B1224]|nr:FkbM family methyltransferase [Pontiellaceae bacterium B1224]